MRYTCNVTIDQPIEELIKIFDNPDTLKEWMPGLEKIEHLSGTPGKPGAESNLHFLHKGKKMVLKEIIKKNDLPADFTAEYISHMGYNQVTISFEALSEGQTKYQSDNYFEFKGVMKYLSWAMKGMFKKQSMIYLNAFKAYAESRK